MGPTTKLIFVIFTMLIASPVLADNWSDCSNGTLEQNIDPQRTIIACSAIISSGRDTKMNLAKAYNIRANAYSAKHDLEAAIADYSAAINLSPGNAVYIGNRAGKYAERGDFDGAIRDYNKVIALAPNETNMFISAYVPRGDAFRSKGDFNNAVADYKRALELNPNNSEARARIAEIGEKMVGDLKSPLKTSDYVEKLVDFVRPYVTLKSFLFLMGWVAILSLVGLGQRYLDERKWKKIQSMTYKEIDDYNKESERSKKPNKKQSLRDEENRNKRLSDEAVKESQRVFEEHLEKYPYAPDALSHKDAYIYWNLMRGWFAKLILASQNHDEVRNKIKSDLLKYIKLLERSQTSAYLARDTKEEKKAEHHWTDFKYDFDTLKQIEDAVAAAIGNEAIEQLKLVRGREKSAFDWTGKKPMAPLGFHYSGTYSFPNELKADDPPLSEEERSRMLRNWANKNLSKND